MERQSISRKITIIIAFMLSLVLMLTGLLLPVKSYADTEPNDPTAGNLVTIAFKVNAQFLMAYRLNIGQKVTQPDMGDLAGRTWLVGTNPYDFNSTVSTNLTLNLSLTSQEAAVVFLYENLANYQEGSSNEFTKNKYWALDVKIVEKNHTVAAIDSSRVPEKIGYHFSYWTNTETSVTAFNFSNAISGTTFLYPKYEINQYTLTFRHYDSTEDTVSVSHGNLASNVPQPKARDGKIAAGWYVHDQDPNSPFSFPTTTITSNLLFLPIYVSADFIISFNTDADTIKMGKFGSFVDPNFTEYTEGQPVANGSNFILYIQLNSNYNQHQLTTSNIVRGGTLGAAPVILPVAGYPGLYKCSLITVGSNISLGLKDIPINKYKVSFDFTYEGISVKPHSTLELDVDYSIDANGDYWLDYNTYFYFELVVGPDHEAEYEVNCPEGVQKNADGGYQYFDDSLVNWNPSRSAYRVIAGASNSEILVTVNTVACVTANVIGAENLVLSGFENPSFYNPLVRWDESTKVARVKKGVRFPLGATPVDENVFYVLSFENLTETGVDRYQYFANTNTDIVFHVVETVFVTVPAGLSGATDVTASSDISGAEASYDGISLWTYRVTKGGTLTVRFTFQTEFSDTDVQVNVAGANATVNKDDFATSRIVYIQNIDNTATITFGTLQRNTYNIGLISNDMATLAIDDAYASSIVEYGGNIGIRILKKVAYSEATVTTANVNITAEKYARYTVTEVLPEGADPYYLITIETIVGSFQVTIADLQKNTYSVSMIGNEYAELTSSSDKAQYGGSFVFVYTLGSAYASASSAIQPTNVKIIDVSTRSEITTYTIEVRAAQSTVTITGIMTSIEVYIDGLVKNTYNVNAAALGSITGVTSNKTANEVVTHGTAFTFVLTFEDPAYTQSIDTINLQYNINDGDYADLEPVSKVPDELNGGGTLTYTIYNITGKIGFYVPELQKNRYTVVFYDTDPELEIKRYNAVVHGQKITEPTKPIKEGYTCTGWRKADGSQYSNFSSGITSDLTLYAKYNARTWNITFDDDGADRTITVNHGKQCVPPAITPRAGHSAYWNLEGINLNSVTSHCTVNAVYTRNNYTVRFLYKSDPTTAIYDKVFETQTVPYQSKATKPTTDPRVQGYTFTTWDYDVINNPILTDTDVHAQFTINKYTIRFINKTQGNSLLTSYELTYNTPMTELEPVAVEGVRGKYQFPYYSGGNLMSGNNAKVAQLSDGFVLEGWYEDEAMSVRYNFANPIKGNVTIYGNMYVSKVSVKFYVDDEFYIEKLVEYSTNLTDIPAVPRKEGYDKTQPQWTIVQPQNGSFENVTNDIKVEAVYTINVYTIQFKFPSGDTLVRQVSHGGTITNVPYPETDFGEVIVMDDSLIKYVTADTVVYITVIDFLPFLIVAAAAGVLTFVVVSLVIAIRNMRRGIKNVKRMEELFAAIKKQDARITQTNEQKLKAEIEEKMREKEKYKRGSFLDD